MTIRDDIFIRLAVSKALGDTWSIGDLRFRLRSVRRVGDSFETIYLDDVPLVRLHEPEFSHETRGQNYILKVSRRYQLLAAALKDAVPLKETSE